MERVRAFRLRSATCFDPRDREHLLEVIASGCGGDAAFERMLRGFLSTALDSGARRESTGVLRHVTRARKLSFTLTSGAKDDVAHGPVPVQV